MAKQETVGASAPANSTGGAAEGLPVDSLREAVPHLRRPFTPEAIKFKVQTVFGGASGCLVVAYIDARLVIERLNLVCPDLWTAAYVPIEGTKLAWCHLTIGDPRDRGFGGDVTRSDVGESPKGMSKDLVSDALKRAAVHFGVGVSVYALPQITLFANSPHVETRNVGLEKKPTLVLTEVGHTKLREGYAKWLDQFGRARFGEPLDHGDVEGATIDEDVEAPEEFVPEPPAALEDEKATGLVESARAVYDEIAALGDGAGRKELPPERFNAWLVGAQHSHEELGRLLEHLNARCEELAAKYGGAS